MRASQFAGTLCPSVCRQLLKWSCFKSYRRWDRKEVFFFFFGDEPWVAAIGGSKVPVAHSKLSVIQSVMVAFLHVSCLRNV